MADSEEAHPLVGLNCPIVDIGTAGRSMLITPIASPLPAGKHLQQMIFSAAREFDGMLTIEQNVILDNNTPLILRFSPFEKRGLLVAVDTSSSHHATWRRLGRVTYAPGEGFATITDIENNFSEQIPITDEQVLAIDKELSALSDPESDSHRHTVINDIINTLDKDILHPWQVDALIQLMSANVAGLPEHVRPPTTIRDAQSIITYLLTERDVNINPRRSLPAFAQTWTKFATLPGHAQDEAKEKVQALYSLGSLDKEVLSWIWRLPTPTNFAHDWESDKAGLRDLLSYARLELDSALPGLPQVVELLVETMIYDRVSSSRQKSSLLFVGPPGVGKSHLAETYANVLQREFHKINLGGIRDPQQLTGFHKTYYRSGPGHIITALASCKTAGPVILVDELDKAPGDVQNVFLSLLDPINQGVFRDTYIDIPYDLSEVIWIATANRLELINPPIVDRLGVFELRGYSDEQKCEIALEIFLPEILESLHNSEWSARHLITPAIIERLVELDRGSPGLRELRRRLEALVKKIIIAELEERDLDLTPARIAKILSLDKSRRRASPYL